MILIIVIFFYLRQNSDISDNKKSAAEKTDQPVEILNKDNNLEEVKKQAIEKANSASLRTVRRIDESDHVLGDIDAPVQLIIYDDFECPFCAVFYDTVEK